MDSRLPIDQQSAVGQVLLERLRGGTGSNRVSRRLSTCCGLASSGVRVAGPAAVHVGDEANDSNSEGRKQPSGFAFADRGQDRRESAKRN